MIGLMASWHRGTIQFQHDGWRRRSERERDPRPDTDRAGETDTPAMDRYKKTSRIDFRGGKHQQKPVVADFIQILLSNQAEVRIFTLLCGLSVKRQAAVYFSSY